MGTIYGSFSADYLVGTNSADTIYGYGGNDSLFGYAGDDYIDSGSPTQFFGGNAYLSGGAGNDTLVAGYGNDTLVGGSGNDNLFGYDGHDRLDGYGVTGIEYDYLTGGSGSDIFVLGGSWGISYLGAGYATITDWDYTADYIEILGSSHFYTLGYGDLEGSSSTDTFLFYQNDLIAVFQDTTNVDLGRDVLIA